MTPEEAVKAAVIDALANEYEELIVYGWFDDAVSEFYSGEEDA